jgi:hypothetical protein
LHSIDAFALRERHSGQLFKHSYFKKPATKDRNSQRNEKVNLPADDVQFSAQLGLHANLFASSDERVHFVHGNILFESEANYRFPKLRSLRFGLFRQHSQNDIEHFECAYFD